LIDMALLGVVLLVAAAAGLAVLKVLVKRADAAAAMLFITVLVQALLDDKVPALELPGGTRLYLTDIVSVAIMAAALARVLRLKRFDSFHSWLLLLGVALGVSLLRGVAAYGMHSAVNDFRQYLFFFGVALYFSTFAPSPGLSARIGRIWLVMTVPMMLLVSLRWLQNFAGLHLGVPAAKWGADAAIRVIDGPYVFLLAQAFVLTIPAWLRGHPTRWHRILSVVLLLMVIVLDRRTAWLALLVGIAVVMLRDRHLGRRALTLVVLGGVPGFCCCGLSPSPPRTIRPASSITARSAMKRRRACPTGSGGFCRRYSRTCCPPTRMATAPLACSGQEATQPPSASRSRRSA